MNRDLIDMVRYARAKRMYVSISTNAHFIRNGMGRRVVDSGLDRLIVSLDGMTEETYREYRVGGSLAAVAGALDSIGVARREEPRERMELVLQFLVNRKNEGEIPLLKSFARSHRAEVALKTMQISSPANAERFLPRQERYRRYRMRDGKLVPKSRMKNRCLQLWERSVITWDGTVVPCCFDKDARHPLGSVRERSFREIWRSEAYQEFRRRILRDRRGVPMCTNCTEGLTIYR
jgi:radical SAM protein with 4Fe4S-binding SPASM domain